MARRGRTIGVGALLGALALALAPAATPSSGTPVSTSARPHAIKLLINGKRWGLELPTGPDKYDPLRSRSVRVEARWTTNARGTGYYVAVSQGATLSRTLVRCTTGTSCVVPGRLSLRVGEELTLNVKIVRTRGDRVVTAYRACLIGR